MPLIVYLDETGDHSLDPVDKDFPVFVLLFLMCEKSRYSGEIVPAVTDFKLKHFGHDGVILHSRDIRKCLGDFGFLQDPERRALFHQDLNELVSSAPCAVIAIAIRKQTHKERYGKAAHNPYELALEFGLERLKAYLDEIGETDVLLVAEARGKKEDDELRLAFLKLLKYGSFYQDFKTINCDLKFVSKKSNVIGHQLADLMAYPIARHAMDRVKPNPAFAIVRTKILDRPGWRHGLKIFP